MLRNDYDLRRFGFRIMKLVQTIEVPFIATFQTSCKGSTFLRKRRDVISHEGVYDPKFVPHAGRIISQGPIYVETDDLGMSNAQYDDQDSEGNKPIFSIAIPIFYPPLFSFLVVFILFYFLRLVRSVFFFL